MSYIPFTFIKLFRCTPMAAGWQFTPTDSDYHCIDVVVIHLSTMPLNILSDLAIILLPLPVISTLRLPRRQKLILVLMLTLAALVVVVGVVRIAYLKAALQIWLKGVVAGQGNVQISKDTDHSFNEALTFMWSCVEVNIGIVCACIPTLRPLVTKMMRLTWPRFQSHPSSAWLTPQEQPQLTQSVLPILARSPPTRGPIYRFAPPKSLIHMTVRESYLPLTIITLLLFFRGCVYSLISILNDQIQSIAGAPPLRYMQLEASYFSGYFFGPLFIGQFVLGRFGFKVTFITGLLIFVTGCMIFWPSAVLLSTAGFIISNFIIALGLSVVNSAAFAFITLCGPAQYAEARLLLSQGVASMGTLVASIVASEGLFKNTVDPAALADAQWTYLAITLFVVLLAVVLFYLPMNEVNDEELVREGEYVKGVRQRLLFVPLVRSLSWGEKPIMQLTTIPTTYCKWPVIYTTLSLAIFSATSYTASISIIDFFFPSYIASLSPPPALTSSQLAWLSSTAFILSCFLVSFLLVRFPILHPSYFLLTSH
ncbi:hypothetical protein V491_09070 [Pseudogymnoascus sp. VKM F-3775]|nr:hypothetical protein V491_09070 [Pseudogymnoascus sp. VKM F-3775]